MRLVREVRTQPRWPVELAVLKSETKESQVIKRRTLMMGDWHCWTVNGAFLGRGHGGGSQICYLSLGEEWLVGRKLQCPKSELNI